MTDIINLEAESGKSIVGDDTTPTLELVNSSTGPGMQLTGLSCLSNASVDSLELVSPILAANATSGALRLQGVSRVSGALLALTGDAFVSCDTIDCALVDQVHGVIRVVRPDGTFGNIPVYSDAAVTAVPLA